MSGSVFFDLQRSLAAIYYPVIQVWLILLLTGCIVLAIWLGVIHVVKRRL